MQMKSLRIHILLCSILLVIGCSKTSDDSPEEQTTPVDKTANLLGTGKSAHDILSNDKFSKLKIEIAYVTGFKPTTEAMNEFVNYLKAHTFKEDIEMVFLELPTADEENLTVQEIADLEAENRTIYNDGETLAIYIYFTDSPAEDDDEEEGLVTLGAVYRNTSMVIHEINVQKLANLNASISIADVEIATLNHEFGHLFGLVNLGTAPVNDHEDVDSDNHCNVSGCLMRSELQFGGSSGKSSNISAKNDLKSACSLSGKSILQMLESHHTSKSFRNTVPLGAECILDIQANGGR